MTGAKGVPEIVNIPHVPEGIRYRTATLNAHLANWARRTEVPPAEALIAADLALDSIDELLARLRRLRRRVVRERRQYDDRD